MCLNWYLSWPIPKDPDFEPGCDMVDHLWPEFDPIVTGDQEEKPPIAHPNMKPTEGEPKDPDDGTKGTYIGTNNRKRPSCKPEGPHIPTPNCTRYCG